MANNVTTCIPCQKNHWIEIQLVDEHAEPITGGISGTLVTNDNQSHDVKLSQGYLLLTEIPAGPVTLKLITEPWLEAVYPHKPRKTDENNSVPAYTQSKMGYQSSSREYKNITVGDLWRAMPESAIPKRHQPGATGQKLVLVADHSYVLEVRAFKFLTVRLGMFFDGTGNNTYNAELAKEQTKNWAIQCGGEDKAESLSEFCRVNPNTGSAGNEITNVEKIYRLYAENNQPVNKEITLSRYIEGIGTTNDGSSNRIENDSGYGMGTGKGETGVDSKVKNGCISIVKYLQQNFPDEFDAIGAFKFDVFGFSRGAAAARHFVNVVVSGVDGYFYKALKDMGIPLKTNFNWGSKENCQFSFVGIFDTVAAIVDLSTGDVSAGNNRNPGINLALPIEQTSKVVHITAADEFRENFSLNRINSAEQFIEMSVPGAHSDIGGGYYSRYYLDTTDPSLVTKALEESIIVSAYTCSSFMYPSDSVVSNSSAWLKAQADKKQLIIDGWATEENISVVRKIKSSRGKNNESYWIEVKVLMHRIVEGDLSRLYLRMMYGFAKHEHVPLKTFDKNSMLHKVSSEINILSESILNDSTNGVEPSDLQSKMKGIKYKYIHHSAQMNTIGSVIHPNAPAKYNLRSVYECEGD
jgi:hypothetical protein